MLLPRVESSHFSIKVPRGKFRQCVVSRSAVKKWTSTLTFLLTEIITFMGKKRIIKRDCGPIEAREKLEVRLPRRRKTLTRNPITP